MEVRSATVSFHAAMTHQEQNPPLVFIDDAHTFGGTQIALAWTIQIVLSRTDLPILCLCTARTRQAIEAVVGIHSRLQFEEAPAALPLNLFAFPFRLPSYWSLLRRIHRRGVAGWWLNQADIEFCLAPLLVLRSLGEVPRTYLHGTGRFAFFYQAASWRRKLLSRLRDTVADRFVFRLHSLIVAPSRASQAEVQARLQSRRLPRLGYLYPPSGEHAGLLQDSAAPAVAPAILQLWMVGNVVQGHKNHRAALDLIEYLARNGHPATLTLAGVGPDMKSFQEEAARRNLASCITYLGWVADPCAIIPKQAIVFIPSFHETMNLVAREAMRYGLRLVVSPIPVFYEWIPEPLIAKDFSAEAFAARILAVSGITAVELTALYQHALARFSDELFLENLLRLTTSSPS